MKAKHPGWCSKCLLPFEAGEDIVRTHKVAFHTTAWNATRYRASFRRTTAYAHFICPTAQGMADIALEDPERSW